VNGNSLFVDTNILLYLLAGDVTIAELLNEKHIYVSFVTELELLGYSNLSAIDLKAIQEIFQEVTIIDINTEIKKEVIALRKQYKLKLPDAIIAATAAVNHLPLLTADKQFSQISALNLLLYEK
jgi:predicted nucleic acid-binding protein